MSLCFFVILSLYSFIDPDHFFIGVSLENLLYHNGCNLNACLLVIYACI